MSWTSQKNNNIIALEQQQIDLQVSKRLKTSATNKIGYGICLTSQVDQKWSQDFLRTLTTFKIDPTLFSWNIHT